MPLDEILIYTLIAEATQYIHNLFLQGLPKNSVIFFDIDDTLIYDYSDIPIYPIYTFYNWIKSLGIIPVIITARSGDNESISFTRCQLERLGITGYHCMFFRNPSEKDVWKYKKACRKMIHDKGFNILMSIGDMPWDIGEFGGYSILLRK